MLTNDQLKSLNTAIVKAMGTHQFLIVVMGHGVYRFDTASYTCDQSKQPTNNDLIRLESAIGSYLYKEHHQAKVIQLYPNMEVGNGH